MFTPGLVSLIAALALIGCDELRTRAPSDAHPDDVPVVAWRPSDGGGALDASGDAERSDAGLGDAAASGDTRTNE